MRGNLLAPDSEGQVRAMRNAYIASGWSPQDIDLIECHGAGTPLGDVVELQSMVNIWGESDGSKRKFPIGSVKSMVGHLLTAAGAAGMIKTLLALKHQILPPSLNFKRAPADSPLHNGPFRVQTETEEWKRRNDDTPLRAAVSAFGFGGINSHLLFEEWNPNIEHRRLKITGNQSAISNQPPTAQSSISSPPVAVIGMASVLGTLNNLREFHETVFRGETVITNRPKNRWNGCDNAANKHLNKSTLWGGFMNELSLYLGELHIPPAEIPDIILQHLLMLKVAVQAMEDPYGRRHWNRL
jgi:acyl transferase domain-containing protein